MTKKTLEKLSDRELADMINLATDRSGDALMRVVQLVDDPAQAASVCAAVAASILRLAGLFGHTALVLEGQDEVTHNRVVAGILFETVNYLKNKPPTESQRARMQKLKEDFCM
jgi:hypothetical protein